MDTITTIFVAVIGLTLLVVVYFFYNSSLYKIKFNVKIITGSKKIWFYDKARVIKDKNGVVICWQLLRRRHRVPIPPPQAIEINNKGKLVVTAYYTEEGEYIYSIDKNDSLRGIDPLTTDDREFFLNELKKAETRKGFKWQDHLMTMGALLFVLVIIVLSFVYWEDISKPAVQISENFEKAQQYNMETTKMLRDIINEQQSITNTLNEQMNVVRPPD